MDKHRPTPRATDSVAIRDQNHRAKEHVITTAVDEIQTDDLRGFPEHPELVKGLTLRTQLIIAHNVRYRPSSLSRVDEAPEENAMRCNLAEFVSQPLAGSPLTHAVGHVIRAQAFPRRESEELRAGTDIEIVLSADGVRFVIPCSTEGDDPVSLPAEGELIHICGTMYSFPSFCNVRLASAITARIRDVTRCRRFANDKEKVWGLAVLDIDSSIKEPDVEMYNPHASR